MSENDDWVYVGSPDGPSFEKGWDNVIRIKGEIPAGPTYVLPDGYRLAAPEGERRGLGRVAHYHFARVWRGRNDERVVTFANGHIYDRAERRRSLRQLIQMMRREKTG